MWGCWEQMIARFWSYAAQHGYMLVSKDTDFHDRSVLYGAPPKVVWLRIGNCTVSDTADLLRSQYIAIRHFHDQTAATFLPLHS